MKTSPVPLEANDDHLQNREQIAKMRDAGKIVAEVLALMEEYAKPGISTAELDQIAEAHIRKSSAVPHFPDYGGFPPRSVLPLTRKSFTVSLALTKNFTSW